MLFTMQGTLDLTRFVTISVSLSSWARPAPILSLTRFDIAWKPLPGIKSTKAFRIMKIMFSHVNAFSLSEMIIVVVMMGALATMMLPMLDQFNKRDVLPSLMKSTTLAINGMTESAMAGNATDLLQQAQDKLDVVKTCNAATSQGCWDTTTQGALDAAETNAGVVLKNGVQIIGLNPNITALTQVRLRMDVNGRQAPNIDGEDQFVLEFCTTSAACGAVPFSTHKTNGYRVVPGALIPATANSQTTYTTLFQT
jgi:type II secretory pathway pseudopilin PulG